MKQISEKNSFRFIHAADTHLDSTLKGLAKLEDAPIEKISWLTREAFTKMVDLAIDLSVDFIILSGDIFDHESPSTATRRFFIKQMSRLFEKNIPVYLIWGNHDAKNCIFKKNELPQNIYCFNAANPESYVIDHLDVVLHGQSYADNAVTTNLALHYPTSIGEKFNIGILHTSLDGHEGHASYAPCDLQTLKIKGYDYWALGHVHKHQILNQNPHIIYPGVLQGRHIHESGEKGCLVIDVDHSQVSNVRFHALNSLRWELLTIDISDIHSIDDLFLRTKQQIENLRNLYFGQFLVVRIHFSGLSALHWSLHSSYSELKERLEGLVWEENNLFWIEKIKILTQPHSNVIDRKDGFGDLALAIEQMISNQEFHPDINKICQEIIEEVPEKIRATDSNLYAISSKNMDPFLLEVQNFLTARLISLENKT